MSLFSLSPAYRVQLGRRQFAARWQGGQQIIIATQERVHHAYDTGVVFLGVRSYLTPGVALV